MEALEDVNMIASLNAALAGLIHRLTAEERGQTMAEYGLILGLIAVVAVAAFAALGTGITGALTDLTGCITTPSSC
jgi:pilus assembly protein Flp/PilA